MKLKPPLESRRVRTHPWRRTCRPIAPTRRASATVILSISPPTSGLFDEVTVPLAEQTHALPRPVNDHREQVEDVPPEDAHVQGGWVRERRELTAERHRLP